MHAEIEGPPALPQITHAAAMAEIAAIRAVLVDRGVTIDLEPLPESPDGGDTVRCD